MQTTRRILPRPRATLRMADGGDVMTRWAENARRPALRMNDGGGYVSVLERGDMSSPAYRKSLENKQALQTSVPEAMVLPMLGGLRAAGSQMVSNIRLGGVPRAAGAAAEKTMIGRYVPREQGGLGAPSWTNPYQVRAPSPGDAEKAGVMAAVEAAAQNMRRANWGQAIANKLAPEQQVPAMADGGTYTKGSTDGGKVVGPGTGISDSVPARYSNGEYVLPADTAEQIGYDKLDEIKDATHTPAAVQRGLRNGGSDGQDAEVRVGGRQAGIYDGVQGRDEGTTGVSGMGGLDDQDRRSLRASLHNLEQVGQTKSLRLADGGIPGIDVLERPFTSADSRAFAAQPGPGNPNVGPNGSAQAQAFRTPPVAPTAAPAASAPPVKPSLRAAIAEQPRALGKVSTGFGRIGGEALRGVAKLAAGPLGRLAGGGGVLANFNDYKINDPDVDSSAGGTFNALRNGDFSGAGRSLSKGALEAGMDLGSAAANTLDYVVPGKAPVSTAYNKMLRSQFGDQLAPHASVTAQANASQIPSPTAQSPRNAANAALSTNPDQDPAPTLAQDPGQGDNVINARRQANDVMEFSGKNVGEGATYDAGNSGFKSSGFGVSTPGSPGDGRRVMAMNNELAAQMQAEREAAEARGPSVTNLSGGFQSRLDRQNAEAGANSIINSGARQTARDALRRMDASDLQRQKDVAETGRATLRESGETARSFARDRVTDRGNVMQNQTSLRNNDATLRSARAKFNYEAGKDQRDFDQKTKEADQAARVASENQLQKNLEAQFRTTDDKGNNIPDSAKIGQYRAAVAATLPALIAELENSKLPAAQARAKELRDRGPSALGDDDYADLKQLFDQRERIAQSRGVLPGKATFKQSDNLLDFRQRSKGGVEKQTFGGDRIVTNNGSSVSLNDLRYEDGPANDLFPDFFKTESGNLTRNLRRE